MKHLKTLTGVDASRPDPDDVRGNPRDMRGNHRDVRGNPRDVRGNPREYTSIVSPEGLKNEDIHILGGVYYIGYRRLADPAHSLKKLHTIVAAKRQLAKSLWKWKEPVMISFHRSHSILGFASITKVGSQKWRFISLSQDLLSGYDAKSVGRTIIHELCHHYRAERFSCSGVARGRCDSVRRLSNGGHDPTFCRELGRVDYIVKRSQTECQFSTDKKMTKSPAASKKPFAGVILKPGAGHLEVTSIAAKTVFAWLATRGKSFFVPFNDNSLALIMTRTKKLWDRIAIRAKGRRFTLRQFATMCVKQYRFKKTAAVLRQR